MKSNTTRKAIRIVALSAAASGLVFSIHRNQPLDAQATTPEPTFSSPIVLDPTDQFLAAVNPDNDTISIISVGAATGTKAQEFGVGREPQSLVFSTDGRKLYVANAIDGTVTVLNVTLGSSISASRVKDIRVGTEPWSVALTPNGRKLYVANSSSNSLSVIDTSTDTVVKTIFRVGAQPKGLAITSDGDSNDDDEKLYVTNFLAQYRPGEIKPGDDLGKVGVVSVVSTETDELVKKVSLQPMAVTGFKANGDALKKIAPDAGGAFTVDTGAFPNILASAAIKNSRVWIPATGSSPNGPNRFNVNVQGLMTGIDIATDTDAGKTVNLNSGIQFEADANDAQGRPLKRFVTNPYFVAFRHGVSSGYLVSAASDMIVKIDFGPDGAPTINPPAAAGQTGNIKRLLVGSNPRAMVINKTDSRGYVWNYVSRDVTVIGLSADLFGTNDSVIGRLVLANQPTDAQAIKVQRGKELFNTSIGPFFNVGNPPVLEGAMSDRGWCSCASCHPNGLTDAVAWMFPAGPRISTPLNSTFAKGGTGQRALNWSAIFDEVADFELNSRGVAGGSGLIKVKKADGTQDTSVTAAPDSAVNPFTVPSAGRSDDRDTITDYVKLGIRSPISPVPADDVRALEGRRVFKAAGCTTCHGGPNWTTSKVEFTPPPPSTALVPEQAVGQGQLIGQLKIVGTFDPTQPFELIGTGPNISKQALGTLGFNVPSLRGIHALGPYLHAGTLETLDQILEKPHWSTTVLTSPTKQKQLIRFLQSIDDSTPPFE